MFFAKRNVHNEPFQKQKFQEFRGLIDITDPELMEMAEDLLKQKNIAFDRVISIMMSEDIGERVVISYATANGSKPMLELSPSEARAFM